MSARLSMRKIKEVLRLKWELELSDRDIARSIQASPTTVGECVKRALSDGINVEMLSKITEEELEQRLYPNTSQPEQHAEHIDFKYIHQELKRKGVTRELLWHEYKENNPEGISYTRFCYLYRTWARTLDYSMHQNHKLGEKLFVDYAGMTIPIVCNVATGEVIEAQIFVACLGASNYTFVEATASQTLPDWIGSHVRAFEFLGGVPEIVVPDNLKAGVHKAHRYEPNINPAYADMAEHYGVAVIPARSGKPQDKAKVEKAVQHIETQILAKLRNRTFFSLYELNQAIKPLLEEVNNKFFQKLQESRKSQFETLERAALRPLPQTPYVFAEWEKAKPGVDYHIVLEKHYYSVPFTFSKKTLDVRYTKMTVEVFYKGKRIASHKRSYVKNRYTTLTEHMPESHRQHAIWTPQRIISWARKNGEFTAKLAEKIISSRPHAQQGYRSCLGIIRLGKSYGNDRVENACKRALAISSYSYKSVVSILKNNLDKQPLAIETQSHATEKHHEHVRGSEYYS